MLGCAAKRQTGLGSVAGALGRWIRLAVPPPRACGTPGAPPVTAPRVRLRDGRHLAYAESGARKEDARFKVVISHGFAGSRLDTVRAAPVSTPLSPASRRSLSSAAFVVSTDCSFFSRAWECGSPLKSSKLFWIFFLPKFLFNCSSPVRWAN